MPAGYASAAARRKPEAPTAAIAHCGLNVNAGLLKGIQIELESLRSFITGGIEFASPPGTARAKAGTVFFLHNEPKKEWLGWAPKIPLAAEK